MKKVSDHFCARRREHSIQQRTPTSIGFTNTSMEITAAVWVHRTKRAGRAWWQNYFSNKASSGPSVGRNNPKLCDKGSGIPLPITNAANESPRSCSGPSLRPTQSLAALKGEGAHVVLTPFAVAH